MVFAAVFDGHFAARLLVIVSPVLLLVLLAAWLYRTTEARSGDGTARQS